MTEFEKVEFDKYKGEYSDSAFWKKLKTILSKASQELLVTALTLFYAMKDSETPTWVKAVAIGALGYLILPFDLIPDFIPVVGLTDDLAVLVAALTSNAAHITDEHKEQAQETLDSWFGNGAKDEDEEEDDE